MPDTPQPPAPVPLAPGGASLSPIVAGAWRMDSWGYDVAQRVDWIERCLALGVTSFDHADIYGGYSVERLFGEALAAVPGLRDRLQIITKCGIRLVAPARPGHRWKSYDSSRAHIVASVEESLRALGTDRIDLLLLHRPDLLLDADEVADTFEALRRDGKVLHFGVSNFSPAQFELLDSRFPLATNQIELHPLHAAPLEDGTLEQLQRLRRRPMIWSPLAGGRLLRGEGEAGGRVLKVLERIAADHGVTTATVAYAWILRHPSRPLPIAGTRRVEALGDAVAALQFTLPADEWYAVWQAAAGREVP